MKATEVTVNGTKYQVTQVQRPRSRRRNRARNTVKQTESQQAGELTGFITLLLILTAAAIAVSWIAGNIGWIMPLAIGMAGIGAAIWLAIQIRLYRRGEPCHIARLLN